LYVFGNVAQFYGGSMNKIMVVLAVVLIALSGWIGYRAGYSKGQEQQMIALAYRQAGAYLAMDSALREKNYGAARRQALQNLNFAGAAVQEIERVGKGHLAGLPAEFMGRVNQDLQAYQQKYGKIPQPITD
jgi:hypothetical protein